MPKLARTFQTRIGGDRPVLAAVAELFSRVARKVDAALARGEDALTVGKTMWEPNRIGAKNLDHILRQVQARSSRKDVGATACPGAGGHAEARPPRRVSTRKS